MFKSFGDDGVLGVGSEEGSESGYDIEVQEELENQQ